jgi:hypothetical protein
MVIPRSVCRWLRLPGHIALVLGLGALSSVAARANEPEFRPDPQDNSMAFGGVLIRTEGGKIYLSEGGKEFRELQMKGTAETRYLKQLLDENKGAVVRVDPMTVADSGAGFMWPMPEKTTTAEKAATPQRPAVPEKTAPTKTDASEGADKSRRK